VSHAAPERTSLATGGVFSGTGRHGGGRRAVRGSLRARRPRGSRESRGSRGSGGPPGPQQSGGAEQAQEARFGQLPYLAVTVGVGIGLLIISQGVHLVRSGTLVLAGVLLIAAMARLVLPERRAGVVSSGRGVVRVAVLRALGIGLLVARVGVPGP